MPAASPCSDQAASRLCTVISARALRGCDSVGSGAAAVPGKAGGMRVTAALPARGAVPGWDGFAGAPRRALQFVLWR